ncbi:hypothetical protein [Lactococcus lactis]|uniref:hypothetical protein n=1 Tax=Lactococcus lactis TaxID=1358 RepID=UPI00345D336C
MGNLGWYQLMTTVAKKVGGPKVLFGLLAVGGYAVIRTVEAGGKKVIKLVEKENKDISDKKSLKSYEFTQDGEGDNGLKFSSGDVFYIAAKDNEAVLIEKKDDENNPYFVNDNWLKSVSSYNGNN